jgi:hypothetical protein
MGLGIAILILGTALLVSPIVLTGAETLGTVAKIGLFSLPVGIAIVLLGGVAPDPRVTTVTGLFGNPVENELRARHRGPASPPARRSGRSPREPSHCRRCYTLVAWDLRRCPRCGGPRDCHVCGRPVGGEGPKIACESCGREEPFCSCVPVRPARPASGPGRLRAV